MISIRPLTLSLALAVSALAALPATAADGYNYGGRSQNERIENGIRNGSLTKKEAADLRDEQRRISERIERARRDGRVDYFERQEIARLKAQASRHIYQEKHDNDSAKRRYSGNENRGGYRGNYRWW